MEGNKIMEGNKMSLLSEYIDIANDIFKMQMLIEDLGNFKKIRPDMMRVFRAYSTRKRSRWKNSS